MTQKLYCYVDETGQDTQGRFFLVALVIVDQEREDLRGHLKRREKRSGKAAKKWTQATLEQKKGYLTEILQTHALQGKIFYREFAHTTDYLACTLETIAQGVAKKAGQEDRVTVIIDSLGKREGKVVGARLRKQGVRVEKVRGVPHKSDEFIRLADAMAGFIRDFLEGAAYADTFYQKAVRLGMIEAL